LVYSRGVLGHSGIEIVNLKPGKTRLLTPSGLDPSWSPDGDHIAFVRGRQTVLLADLATEHELKNPPHEHRDIWLIKADGAEEPRFLTRGHWPSWSRDSKRVLYYLPEAMRIYSISIEEGSEPRPIVWCPSNYPAISPDGKYVAFASYRSGFLRVVDISSRSLIASWAGPQGMLFANWSSDGRRLTVAAGWGPDMGLWIYDMGAREASKVLSGRIMRGRWSPDGSRMAFALAPPVSEIWIADTESLGPGRTLEEHYEETCQEDIDRLTIQIETYPEDVKYYRWRAKANIYLGDTEKTLSDLKKYTDLVNNPNVAAKAYDYAGWPLVLRHQEMVNPEFAVELYRKAHELQPKNWIYLCGLGAAHYRAGQWEEAIAKLTMSTELANGENGLNYLFLAMAHQQSGNEAAAADWYNKAMEWIEDSNNNWLNVRNKTIYDIYLEAAELMGIKPKEF